MSRIALHRRAVALGGVLWALLGTGCGPLGRADASDQGADQDDEEEIATPVVTHRVHRGEISAEIRATSTIEAERMVTVHAESTGRITVLAIEEGDEVKADQQLARIKQDTQRSGLTRASTSRAQAERDLQTVRALAARGAASADEVLAAERALEMARLDVRDRKRDVSNTRVRAPFAGTVTQRFVSEGAFVSTGAQLLSVVDFDTLVARVYVPEKELDRLRTGQDAEIVGKAAKGRHGIGTLRRIAPIVDAATGTVKVTIGLPAALVGGETGFLPGMYAEVTLTTETRPEATLVPKQALIYDEEQPYVFVALGERVSRAKVELGLTDRDHAEVVSGVSVGDEIGLAGLAGLEDGGLVTRVDSSGRPVEGPDASPRDASSAGGEGEHDRSGTAEVGPAGAPDPSARVEDDDAHASTAQARASDGGA